MPSITPPAQVSATLRRIGSNIRTARLRRGLPMRDVGDRVGASRYTVASVEKGKPGVSVAAYLTVLWALDLLDDANHLADPDRDEEGTILQAARLPSAVRLPPLRDDF